MTRYARITSALLFMIAMSFSSSAQVNDDTSSGLHPIAVSLSDPLPLPDATSGNIPYTLKRGDNEFGFWGGVSFKATTIFAGLRKDEAADRKFVVAAFRYGRTLAANNSVALQYTLDVIPLAVATGVIVSRTTIGSVTTFRRETAYGAGLIPAALQLDFANGSKIHPFVHVNGGFLIFNKSVPIEDSGKFAFVGEAGTGVRIFTSDRRAVSLGVRFHHISNGNRSGSNRGLNQFIFYAGLSVFK